MGCGRRRYCGRVCCLSRRRVLALRNAFSVSRSLVVSPDGVPARSDATFLWRPSPSTPQNRKNTPACIHSPDRCHLPLAFLSIPTKKRHPAVPTLPDTGTKTPVKQTYTIYNQHSLSAQLNYHQKVLSATQDRWPAL